MIKSKCQILTKDNKKWLNDACTKFQKINLCKLHSNVVNNISKKMDKTNKKWKSHKKWYQNGGWGDDE